MNFDSLAGSLNKSCLASFGKRYAYTSQAPSSVPQPITGILDTGVELENAPPGEGSTYAALWLQIGDINPAPQVGDKVASDTTVYEIVQVKDDAGGGMLLVLRQAGPVA